MDRSSGGLYQEWGLLDEKMRLMADVIDLAIDKYLWDGHSDTARGRTQFFSCSAIVVANNHKESETEKIMDFLRSMGVNPNRSREFRSIRFGQRRQYARALWLTWAAMIAREECKTL